MTYLRAALGPEAYLAVVASPRFVGAGTSASSDEDGQVVGLHWLSTISVRRTRRRGLVLRLAEPGGRPLDLPLGAVEANQQLWDLVYDGLRPSAAAGAEVDSRTRELLELPPPRPLSRPAGPGTAE